MVAAREIWKRHQLRNNDYFPIVNGSGGGVSISGHGNDKMRKKLNVLAIGILAAVMMASGAQASDAKFVFRMPGTKVAAAVAPTEPEELRPFALGQLSFAYKSIPTGSEIEVQISVKNDSDHLASIIFHDLVFAGFDSGSTSIHCDVFPNTTAVCTTKKPTAGVSSRKVYVEEISSAGQYFSRHNDADQLPPDFNVQ